MATVLVKYGIHAGRNIGGTVFTFVHGIRPGLRGSFISVNGTGVPGFPQRNFRVIVRNEDDFTVDESGSVVPQAAPHYSIPLPTEGPVFEAEVEPPKEETDEEILARIDERFTVLKEMTGAAARGQIRSLVVVGAPGVGKSHEVIHTLESMNVYNRIQFEMMEKLAAKGGKDELAANAALAIGLKVDDAEMIAEVTADGEDPDFIARDEWTGKPKPKQFVYDVVQGHVSASAMFKVLYDNKDPHNVLIFDDCDSALLDESSLNLLKVALDTKEKRIVSWLTAGDRRDDLPHKFEFQGTVIFISNIDFEKTVQSKNKIAPHLEAIMSRALYLDLTIHTMREKLVRINYVVRELGMLKREGLEPEQVEEVIEWVNKYASNFRELSLRKVGQVGHLRKMGGAWRRNAKFSVWQTRKQHLPCE